MCLLGLSQPTIIKIYKENQKDIWGLCCNPRELNTETIIGVVGKAYLSLAVLLTLESMDSKRSKVVG